MNMIHNLDNIIGIQQLIDKKVNVDLVISDHLM